MLQLLGWIYQREGRTGRAGSRAIQHVHEQREKLGGGTSLAGLAGELGKVNTSLANLGKSHTLAAHEHKSLPAGALERDARVAVAK